jgi:hypothetical protein
MPKNVLQSQSFNRFPLNFVIRDKLTPLENVKFVDDSPRLVQSVDFVVMQIRFQMTIEMMDVN